MADGRGVMISNEWAAIVAENDRLKKENAELITLFTPLDDPGNAFILYEGKYVIQRIKDYEGEQKSYACRHTRGQEKG